MPGTDEVDLDCFRDVQRGVRLNEKFRGEFLDFELPRRRGRRKRNHQRGQQRGTAEKVFQGNPMVIPKAACLTKGSEYLCLAPEWGLHARFCGACVSPAFLRSVARWRNRLRDATKSLCPAKRFVVSVPPNHITVRN